jgi:hypothetical protein
MTRTRSESPELKINNQSAIALCKNPVYHNRSKHIDVHYHFLQKCVENGEVVVSYTMMKNQLADLLTKALGRTHF